MKFRNPFRPRENPPRQPLFWEKPAFAHDAGECDDPELEQLDREFEKLQAQWNNPADLRDPAAWRQNTAIAGQLEVMESVRAERRRAYSQAKERQALVEELSQVYVRATSELEAASDALIAAAVPDAKDIARVYILTRERETIRVVLFEATGQPQFARPCDGLDRVRFGWHQQQLARMRLLDRVRSKHGRPQLPRWSWEATVSRLHGLINEQRSTGHEAGQGHAGTSAARSEAQPQTAR